MDKYKTISAFNKWLSPINLEKLSIFSKKSISAFDAYRKKLDFKALLSLLLYGVNEEVMNRDLLEVLPLTHIRGRSLHDAFVIVDEAQSLERNVLLTVLSRIGMNSKVVLTHDVAQRDNLRVGRHDGVAAVIEKLKGHDLFAHVTLTRSERSEIAALVTDVLEEFDPFRS